ncbi:7744_t:CDS:2 [Funneliformis mosseae]|uniref:7744_t:CDS:1 n=1 Tax=Funneliformis mosseae TaxID=27381 RepID=A0A9N9F1J5_FUNMO|nr:7744_t:CDS:2 [Funneliformis mosseae]
MDHEQSKSRFLQELPTLLRNQAHKYLDDDELLNIIKDHMFVITVTFGNGSGVSIEKKALKITDALNIVIKYVNSDRMTTNCSIGNIFYIPILAETIQGPLEEMFKFLTYRFQPLPLRLLRDEKAWKVSEFVASSEYHLAK